MAHVPEGGISDFAAAAAVLRGDNELASEAAGRAHALLDELGYPGSSSNPAIASNRAALLLAAARLRDLFRLGAPDAPGLVFLGGIVDPSAMGSGLAGQEAASLAGAGLRLAEAFEACIGEGAEYLSQFELEEDRATHSSVRHPGVDEAAAAFYAAWMGRQPRALDRLPWVPAIHLGSGAAASLPADLVFRRNQSRRCLERVPLGSGCAAGATWERALLAALLEVIERDEVALWWHGGAPAACVPDGLLAEWGLPDLLAQLRRDRSGRRVMVLDISSDLGVTCLAALSFEANGRGFAGGYAAAADPARAMRRAIIEMCQMELGRHLIEVKCRQAGRQALNAAERRHLARATMIGPETCTIPARPFRQAEVSHVSDDPTTELASLIQSLARAGHSVYAANLTRRALAIPVAKVIVPGLQPCPSTFVSPRLSARISETKLRTPQGRRVGLF